MARLLIVGNMADKIGDTAKLARAAGFHVAQASNIISAVEEIKSSKHIDLAMVDSRLDLGKFLSEIPNQQRPSVIACGEEIRTPAKIIALKQKYIPLPMRREQFEQFIKDQLENKPSNKPALPFLTADKKTIAMLERISLFAKSTASILITGESGTGKEVLAKTIHLLSNRRDKKFLAFNCAAIPEHLLESELFGYEKGAFTGALNRKIGKFEEAHGGTLLLDEISEMDLRLQAKLLRVLQEKEIDRLGGLQPIKIDVRILATSNRNLLDYIKKGKFREDLYYRLNVVEEKLPPLRERKADIAHLAQYFTEQFGKEYKKPTLTISDSAMKKLTQHHFHGNVRELENAIHRAVIIATDSITPDHLHLIVRH